MSDLPPPDPVDEQATDLLDANADAPAGDDALAARLRELRSVRALLADVAPPDHARRERSITAAMAAFEPAAPVVALAPRRRRRLIGGVAGALAAAAAIAGIGIVAARNGNESTSGGALGRATTSGTTAAGADARAAATAGASTEDQEYAGAATTAAATASPAPVAASTTATAKAANSTAAGAATTSGAAPSTAAASGATTTARLAAALPYVGDVGSNAALDAVVRAFTQGATTTVASTAESGVDVRNAFAAARCDLSAHGEPLALARYQGRPAVVTLIGTDVHVVGLDDCSLFVSRPRPG